MARALQARSALFPAERDRDLAELQDDPGFS